MKLLQQLKQWNEISFLGCAGLIMSGVACLVVGSILLIAVNTNQLVAGLIITTGCVLVILSCALANFVIENLH